jgi:hypothetical protein
VGEVEKGDLLKASLEWMMQLWVEYSVASVETWQGCGPKVTVSISTFDLFPHPRITPFCIFSLTYSCTCLELLPRRQSMEVHDLAKNEWILFTARKWMQFTNGNSDLR